MKLSQKALGSKIVFSLFVCTFLTQLHGADQNVVYFDGKENKTMGVKAAAFAPTHPDCCTEKKKIEPTPITTATPAPTVPVVIEKDSDGDGVLDAKDECPETPKGYQIDAKGCPQRVTLHINFAFASNLIPTSAAQDVIDLTNFMKKNPASKISIVGHTDIIGIDARNQPRSEARSRALADRLIANGIDASRIQTSGKGSKEPIATNDTDAGRAQNRRIEIEIR